MSKPFHFKQFKILQDDAVFRVGTDGVLLGALNSCEKAQLILEVGTGTGLISLMIAQRNSNTKILAIDINAKAVSLAQENFKNSPFSERLSTDFIDFKLFKTNDFFDLIICNPPFFEENNSQKDILARQQIALNFDQLICTSVKYLSKNGIFSVIIPKNAEEDFINKCKNYNLYLFKRVNIKGNLTSEIKRVVLEFSFEKKELSDSLLVLETAPRVYSPQYLELTKNFHLFKK